eukprot:6632968-Alexandrium_andersonii.AAC.1
MLRGFAYTSAAPSGPAPRVSTSHTGPQHLFAALFSLAAVASIVACLGPSARAAAWRACAPS